MLLVFIGSFAKDALKLIKTEKDFVDLNEHERHDLVKKHLGDDYPQELTDYLLKIKGDSFLDELKSSVDYLGTGIVPKHRHFLDAVLTYIAKNFAMKLDYFDYDFFFQDIVWREKLLLEVFPGDSFFQKEVRDYVSGSTYQEITEQGQKHLRDLKNSPIVIIQSATSISKETLQQVRKFFSEKYPYSFVEFQINPQIIGGLRVFIDGVVVDYSWLSKIQKISQLAYQLS